MNFKAIFFICMLFFSFLFAATASMQTGGTILVVNSKDWKDVLAGGVYAAQNKYSYLFILTQNQADYLISLFKNDGKSTILYYESKEPVVEDFVAKLKLEVPNAKLNKQENLADFFASISTQKKAIIVGSDDVENSLVAASYAALSGSNLYFASKDNIQSLALGLLAKKNSVLVYGNLASATNLENVEKINKGSIYLNNLELLAKLQAQGYEIKQVVFASGRTFEESILSNPVVLVGRTEVTKELLEWIKSNQAQGKLTQGVVYAGDADIEGAIKTIKKETGLAVFTKFATGFSSDAEAKPNIVLELPAKLVKLQLNPPVYDYATSTLSLEVINLGNTNAYVRVVAQFPNGKFVGSEQKKLEPMEIVLFSVPLSSAGLQGQDIEKAVLNVYSSKEEQIVEAIDVVEFKNVKYINKPAAQPSSITQQPSTQQAPQTQTKPVQQVSQPSSKQSTSPLSYDFYSWAFVALVIIVLVVVYLYSSKKIQPKESKHKEHHKAKKD